MSQSGVKGTAARVWQVKAASVLPTGNKAGVLGWQELGWPGVFRAGVGEVA